MTSEELFAKMKMAAIAINQQDEFGALHIFVSDGNCEDDHLEFCLGLENITPAEREFAEMMLSEFTEEQRIGAWAIAQCSDTQPLPHPA